MRNLPETPIIFLVYSTHQKVIFYDKNRRKITGPQFAKRTTRAEPEDHLWSADHSLGNATPDGCISLL
jgi:hypothetical protein